MFGHLAAGGARPRRARCSLRVPFPYTGGRAMQRTGGRPAERVRLRTPGPPRELSGQINVTVSELAHDYIPSSHAELDRVLSSRSV